MYFFLYCKLLFPPSQITANGSLASRLMMLMSYKSLPTATHYELLRHVTSIPTNDKGMCRMEHIYVCQLNYMQETYRK